MRFLAISQLFLAITFFKRELNLNLWLLANKLVVEADKISYYDILDTPNQKIRTYEFKSNYAIFSYLHELLLFIFICA